MRSTYSGHSNGISGLNRRLASFKSYRLTLLIVAVAAFSGCMAWMAPPANLDYSRVRSSVGGQYHAAIKPEGDSIPKGKLQKWTLHLESRAGSSVDAAKITIDGGMPQHGHGLPTKPLVTRPLGNGDYRVEGMKFNMGGWWVVKLTIDGAKGSDVVTFNLKL